MNPNTIVPDFFIAREPFDRRAERLAQPPYLTVEGFVLIDRRTEEERRANHCDTPDFSTESSMRLEPA